MNSQLSVRRSFLAFLFDIDGTLVDSNDAHAHAWVKAFAEAGIPVEFPTVRCAVDMGADKLMPAVAGIDAESPLGTRISERRGRTFKSEYLPTLRAFPGVGALLAAIQSLGMKTHAALKKTGVPASEAVMIGDTPYDMEAASRAGVATIAFRCGGWKDSALHGALAIYDGPRDLLERLEDSPLAKPNSQFPILNSQH